MHTGQTPLVCGRKTKITSNPSLLNTVKASTLFALLASCISNATEIVKISASSAQQGNPAPAAFDNQPGTRWAAEGSGQWIAASFSEPLEVNSVEIGFHNGNRKYSFDIEVTNDGNSWENLGSFTSAGKSNNFPRGRNL